MTDLSGKCRMHQLLWGVWLHINWDSGFSSKIGRIVDVEYMWDTLQMQCLFSKNGTQSTYRRLALEPVALSFMKNAFQLTPFIAVLLNV